MQLVMRRQKIEYKLKMIQKIASSDQPPQGNEEMSRAEAVAAKPVLLSELNELRNSIEVMIRDYESHYGEKFERARAGNHPQQQQDSQHQQQPMSMSMSRSQMSPSPPKQRTTPGHQQQQQQQQGFSGNQNQRSPAHQPRRTPPSHKSPPPQSMSNRF